MGRFITYGLFRSFAAMNGVDPTMLLLGLLLLCGVIRILWWLLCGCCKLIKKAYNGQGTSSEKWMRGTIMCVIALIILICVCI